MKSFRALAMQWVIVAMFCSLLPTTASADSSAEQAFEMLTWTDLIPPDDLEILMNPPEYIADIQDGSAEDQISSQVQNSLNAASDDRYQQALSSTRVNDDLNGTKVRVPGFIVPLEFDDEQAITQFFLVPYFGACIHMPPPPPNQMIMVNYEAGLQLEELYTPFWVSGELATSVFENDVGTAAYSMKMVSYELYDE